MWLPLSLCSLFAYSTVQLCLPLFFLSLAVRAQWQKPSVIKAGVVCFLTEVCVWDLKDHWGRCWGDGLQMPQRRSRCRRRRWVFFFFYITLFRDGKVKVQVLKFTLITNHKTYSWLVMKIAFHIVLRDLTFTLRNHVHCLCVHIFSTQDVSSS